MSGVNVQIRHDEVTPWLINRSLLLINEFFWCHLALNLPHQTFVPAVLQLAGGHEYST